MQAYSLLRRGPLYRTEAIHKGVEAAGYKVVVASKWEGPQAGNVMLMWNRYMTNHDIATRFEAAGGKVWVFENGYVAQGGGTPKFEIRAGQDTDHYIAIAERYHNGAGKWPSGGPERWRDLGIDLKPWRKEGRHILVCPNRPFGVPGQHMDHNWPAETVRRLKMTSRREVRLRPHPGNDPPKRSLDEDLADCWCMVIWNSSAGVHALAQGVPVVCESKTWVLKGAASSSADAPETPDRTPHFERMAWAQWRLSEIERGDPFFLL